MESLSVAIITRNEASNIRDCLESVAWADEIVVVDHFSEDGTADIARDFGAQVFQEPWHGFAAQKNIALERARGPWILSLDADERVSPPLREEISAALGRNRVIQGYYISRRNFFRGKWIRHGGWFPDYTLRLFLKDAGKFQERDVHERVVVTGRAEHLKHHLDHYTYRSVSDYLLRMDRYSRLAARELQKRGMSFSWTSSTLRPLFTFLKMYVLKRGFMDGREGLFLATSYAYYTFLKYWRVLEDIERIGDPAEGEAPAGCFDNGTHDRSA